MNMKFTLACALLLLGSAATTANDLSANPAFCVGYLSAQSPSDRILISNRLALIRTQFAKTGPKVSTDERNFEDWRNEGSKAAVEDAPKATAMNVEQCRRLLSLPKATAQQ